MKTTLLNPTLEPLSEGIIGRQAVLEAVRDQLNRDQPQNYNLIGQPRIGKTSILYHIYQHKIGLPDGLSGVYVWVQLTRLATPSSLSFWHLMWTQLMNELQIVGLPTENEPDENSALAFFDALDAQIGRSLHQLQRIIFLLDDFDLLFPANSKDQSPFPGIEPYNMDWLRSLITRYPDSLAFVITSTTPLVKLEQRRDTNVSPLANYFASSWIGLLSAESAVMLCHRAATIKGVAGLNETDLHFLLAEAGRHPYLLKVACDYLFAAWQPGRDQAFYAQRQYEIRADAHVESFCQVLIKPFLEKQRPILQQLALGETVPEGIVLTQLRKQYALVEERDGKTVLFADVLRYWLCHELGIEMAEVGKTAVSPTLPSPFTLHHLPEERLVQVYWKTEPVALTPMENRLLQYLSQHPNKVCPTDELLKNIWGENKSTAVVEKTINRLRFKIEEDYKKPRYIFSARGEGYLLRL